MPELRDLELLHYWQGQLLRSRDLRDQSAMDAQRSWWHNRAVHAAFGVSYGLAVNATATGSFGLTVDCGLAYDCFGRELVLPTRSTAPKLPPGSDPLLLLISYGPQLAWQPEARVRISDGVPLARVIFQPEPSWDKTFHPAPARAIARPRLASGDTVRGNTPWEPWIEYAPGSDGNPAPLAIGVQTRVDTKAAGFTATPEYFATLQWPDLRPEDESFATAYFPSIAEETPEGFLFRLLMRNIARLRLSVTFGRSEVSAPPSGDFTSVKLNQASAFRAGDMVARVRPVARAVAVVDSAAGKVMTLHAPLAGVQKDGFLAVGNPPRTATVTAFKGAETAMVVTIGAAIDVQPGDLILQTDAAADPGTPSLITDVKGLAVTLDTPIKDLAKNDQVGFARPTETFTISGVAGGEVTVDLPEAFHLKDIVVRTTAGADPVAALVTQIQGKVLTLQPPIAGLTSSDVLSRVTQTAAVSAVTSSKRAMRVTVDTANLFRAGDFVARLDAGIATSVPVVVEAVDKKGVTLSLASAIDHLEKGNTLGAANAGPTYGVVGVTQAGNTMSVTVATPAGFTAGDVVAQVTDTGTSPPVVVDSIKDKTITLRGAIEGLAAGALLLTARFPRTAGVTAIGTAGNFPYVQVDRAGAFRTGDMAMRIADGASAQPAALGIVLYAAGQTVVLLDPPGEIQVGDQIGPVSFSAQAVVADAKPAGNPTTVTIDRTLDFRSGDVVGPLLAYTETSGPQAIAAIQDNTVTLGAPIDGLTTGDILGPASFSLELNRIRFDSPGKLLRGDQLQLSGLSAGTLLPASVLMRIATIDNAQGIATLAPVDSMPPGLALRPETLSIAALFNANFVGSFVSFAQRQHLYICWLGCQEETPKPEQCPGGTGDPDPCAGTGA